MRIETLTCWVQDKSYWRTKTLKHARTAFNQYINRMYIFNYSLSTFIPARPVIKHLLGGAPWCPALLILSKYTPVTIWTSLSPSEPEMKWRVINVYRSPRQPCQCGITGCIVKQLARQKLWWAGSRWETVMSWESCTLTQVVTSRRCHDADVTHNGTQTTS